MKILLIHSNGFKYEVLDEARGVQGEQVEEKEFSISEKVLVAFISVEEKDQPYHDRVIKRATNEIEELLTGLKETNIVLYPWAHLSDQLATPQHAQAILSAIYDSLAKKGYNAHKAAFGWYKSFQLSCLGHNRAENLRSISLGKDEDDKVDEIEEHPSSSFFIYTPKDQLIGLDVIEKTAKGKSTFKIQPKEPFAFDAHKDLFAFLEYEMKKERTDSSEPPHIAMMKHHELASTDPSSDPGNYRWYPRGRVMRRLIEEFAYNQTMQFGAVPIETPIMYNLEIPAVREQVKRFPARQYQVFSGKKQLFLRYASDFGMFFMISNIHLSYRNLPLRVYELTKYAFRREKRGELSGLRRLRAFTMPDLHTFCKDLEAAKKEFDLQYDLCLDCMHQFEVPIEIAFRTTKEFFNENRTWINEMIKKADKPILLELFDERNFYWVLKFEFNVIDALKKAAALSTVQIDLETAKRYDISYQTTDGQREYPIILHNSPTGAVERVIYAILEKAAKAQKKGQAPLYPLWLAPTQVRLIPINETHIEFCEEIRQQFHDQRIRVDIDDRSNRPNKRVRSAEREWVPYILLIGDNEIDQKQFPVRTRTQGRDIRTMELSELIAEILDQTKGKPTNPLPLPYQRLSSRPTFIEQL